MRGRVQRQTPVALITGRKQVRIEFIGRNCLMHLIVCVHARINQD